MEIFKGRDSTPPSVATLKVEIPVITLSIEYDKKISLTTIVLIVLEMARILLKHIHEQINEMLVEEYCEKRYERGKEYKQRGDKGLTEQRKCWRGWRDPMSGLDSKPS